MRALCIFLVTSIISCCVSRDVNIVVRHIQEFSVLPDEERTHVVLPNVHERLLGLDEVPLGSPGIQELPVQATYFDGNIYGDVLDDKTVFKDYDGIYRADTLSIGLAKQELSDEEELARYYNDLLEDDEDHEETLADEDAFENHIRQDIVSRIETQDDIEKNIGSEYSLLSKYKNLPDQDIAENQLSRLHKVLEHHRNKRAAREQWLDKLPGATPPPAGRPDDNDDPSVWDEVTDEDLKKASYSKYKDIAKFVGVTLLSVVGFTFLAICFIRDPVAFIFAFGTGCPCCLICCPCVRAFTDKYLDTKNLVKDSMNKYMPGVIMKDDGSLDFYEPTSEEIALLHELMDECMP